jgi:hypothetical protein
LDDRSRSILDDDDSQPVAQRRREDSSIARTTLGRRGLRGAKPKEQR